MESGVDTPGQNARKYGRNSAKPSPARIHSVFRLFRLLCDFCRLPLPVIRLPALSAYYVDGIVSPGRNTVKYIKIRIPVRNNNLLRPAANNKSYLQQVCYRFTDRLTPLPAVFKISGSVSGPTAIRLRLLHMPSVSRTYHRLPRS